MRLKIRLLEDLVKGTFFLSILSCFFSSEPHTLFQSLLQTLLLLSIREGENETLWSVGLFHCSETKRKIKKIIGWHSATRCIHSASFSITLLTPQSSFPNLPHSRMTSSVHAIKTTYVKKNQVSSSIFYLLPYCKEQFLFFKEKKIFIKEPSFSDFLKQL